MNRKQVGSARVATERAMNYYTPAGASKLLLWCASLEATDDVEFSSKMGTLQQVWRQARSAEITKRKGGVLKPWHEDPKEWMPAFREILQAYDWDYDHSRLTIMKTDARGVERSINVEEDGLHAAKKWLELEWRHEMFMNEGRVWDPKKRRKAGQELLAVGLDLPAPSDHKLEFATAGHKRVIMNGKVKSTLDWKVALATSANGWQIRHGINTFDMCNKKLDKFYCACGKEDPSLAHIAWNCSAARQSNPRPRDTAEERLLMKRVTPSTLPASWNGDKVILNTEEQDEFTSMLRTDLVTEKKTFLMGCDGGSKEKAASWAISHEGGWTANRLIRGEDYTPLKAELCAAEALTGAIAAAVQEDDDDDWNGVNFDISIDCKPAMSLINKKGLPLERWRHVAAVHDAVTVIKGRGAAVRWHWTPSHGKTKASFKPTINGQALRRVNDWADKAATRAIEAALKDKTHRTYILEMERAEDWSTKAILFTAEKASAHVTTITEAKTVQENLDMAILPEHDEADELARLMEEQQAAEYAAMMADDPEAEIFWSCTMD
eukprot:TRINITY_DN33476_c0_g1_i7.p1 TRINITY_DN33476_c0_g1~~TRINITY_DN33476_c0_g1_i7.p1  ORF type:complete len:550 (-),score=112.00 TRINITY_DN33476_c0_g1_i7:148-1797(-)